MSQPPLHNIGIIGAGAMGRGIAEVVARAGLTVHLTDIDAQLAAAAVQQLQSDTGPCANLHAARSLQDLAHVELVIEAIPENAGMKSELYRQLQSCLSADVILATNTSALSVTELAQGWHTPAQFCGLHFCYPVPQRRLVEVIAGQDTTPDVLSTVNRFVEQIGQTALPLSDSPGFILNRLLVPYLNTSLDLLLHGASPKQVEQAALAFGMPKSPLMLLDEFGIDVCLAVGQSLYRAWPERVHPSELLIAMYKSRRWGRKTGSGFYDWTTSPPDRLAPATLELIKQRRRTSPMQTDAQVAEQMFAPMREEAELMMAERFVPHSDIINTAIREGLGTTTDYRGLLVDTSRAAA